MSDEEQRLVAEYLAKNGVTKIPFGVSSYTAGSIETALRHGGKGTLKKSCNTYSKEKSNGKTNDSHTSTTGD